MAARCCARCGKRFKRGESRIFSRFTRSSYCTDLDACNKRTRRKAAAK